MKIKWNYSSEVLPDHENDVYVIVRMINKKGLPEYRYRVTFYAQRSKRWYNDFGGEVLRWSEIDKHPEYVNGK